MRIKCLFLVISVISITSCDLFTESENQIVTKVAVLFWSGEYAVDGCGFSVEFDHRKYKPENEDIIPDDFKNNSETIVKIRFIYLNNEIEYYCGFSETFKAEGIKIIKISNI